MKKLIAQIAVKYCSKYLPKMQVVKPVPYQVESLELSTQAVLEYKSLDDDKYIENVKTIAIQELLEQVIPFIKIKRQVIGKPDKPREESFIFSIKLSSIPNNVNDIKVKDLKQI